MKFLNMCLLEGASGRIKDYVFYTRNGKTYMRKATAGYNKTPTSKQAPVRERFIAANEFARLVIADPALKALYEKKAKKYASAYITAVSEYMLAHR